jgi:hypothetical protein
MQALLLPARSAPPPPAVAASMLRQHAVSASACASQSRRPLPGSAGRLRCGVRESTRRRLTAAAAPSSSSSPEPIYPTPPPSEEEMERAKLEQVLCLSLLWLDLRIRRLVLCSVDEVGFTQLCHCFILGNCMLPGIGEISGLESRIVVSCGLLRWLLV